jgi:hypothetical protein
MSGTVLPLPQYGFMAWFLVKAEGQLYLNLYIYFIIVIITELVEFPLMGSDI